MSGTHLAQISKSVLKRVSERQVLTTDGELLNRIDRVRAPNNFLAAIAQSPSIIAEIKYASPSQGKFACEQTVSDIARDYMQSGAAALSVLTEKDFFSGSLENLVAARRAAPDAPILMKDFVLSERQIIEAKVFGADAVLLMASLLDDPQLAHFKKCVDELGLQALVEVHNERELERALKLDAQLIGVNSRDLKTLSISLEVFEELIQKIPRGPVLVAESGLSNADQVIHLTEMGYSGFLIGSHFMKTGTPGAALAQLIGALP